jgi:hypothetical protein
MHHRFTAGLVAAALSFAACFASAFATGSQTRLQDVLASVSLSFAGDGGLDRALLIDGADGADLIIYRDPPPRAADREVKPAFIKKDVVSSGRFGAIPSLAVNAKGSLVIGSSNEAVGRDRWSQRLTVLLRDGTFVIAGITYTARDTLDPKGGGSCDLNLLTGKGERNGKPVTGTLKPIELAAWTDGGDAMPAACRF